jgi:hypothetical protein
MRMGATAVPKLTPSGKMQVPKSPLQKTSKSDSRFRWARVLPYPFGSGTHPSPLTSTSF